MASSRERTPTPIDGSGVGSPERSAPGGVFGEGVADACGGVTVAHPMFGLEPVDEFGVFGQPPRPDELLPVGDGPTVLLLDRREV